jgi:TonB family protein
LASLLFICPAAFSSDGAANSLESALLAKYGKQVVTLRGFYQDKNLHFDSKGTVLDKVHPGSWTLSRMEIEKIRVSETKVELSGPRLAELNNAAERKLVLVPTKQQVQLTVARDAAEPDTVVMKTIDRLFLNESDHVGDLVPDYWRDYLLGEKEVVPQDDGTDCRRTKGRLIRLGTGELTAACEEHKKDKSAHFIPPADHSSIPYRVGNGVKPPKAVYAPDPKYSAVALSLNLEGTCVLELTVAVEGNTTDVDITRPVGGGLDEQAVAAVKEWRFLPATLKGVPVATRVNIEVRFRLH